MTSVLLEPIEGKNYRLIPMLIGFAISVILTLTKIVNSYLDFVPLTIGAVVWWTLFHFAWKGFDSKTGRWDASHEWENQE